eukprot:7943779-Alexandrium_andersonii.AAC.1
MCIRDSSRAALAMRSRLPEHPFLTVQMGTLSSGACLLKAPLLGPPSSEGARCAAESGLHS